jgi:hypothetical protein
VSFTTSFHLKREQAYNQWQSSRVTILLLVHTVKCVQTLKAKNSTLRMYLTMNSVTALMASHNTEGQEWYIENVLEELDDAREW